MTSKRKSVPSGPVRSRRCQEFYSRYREVTDGRAAPVRERKFLVATYREVLEEAVPAGVPSVLIKAAIAYTLQYLDSQANDEDLSANAEENMASVMICMDDAFDNKLDISKLSPRLLEIGIDGDIRREMNMAKTTEQSPAQKKTFARSKGTTTGLGVHGAWAHIFSTNGKCKKAARLTNEQITDWMNAEFPEKQSAVYKNVNGVRREYNNGKFTDGPPAVQSVCYDEDGNVMEVKRGRRAAAPKDGETAAPAAPAKKDKPLSKAAKLRAAKAAQAAKDEAASTPTPTVSKPRRAVTRRTPAKS